MKNEFFYSIIKNRVASITAGAIAASLVFSATFLISFSNSYQSYWQAIYRVQTVDFNIIAHTYPHLVSRYISENDDESLKQLLNSNFSRFTVAADTCIDPQCAEYQEWAINSGLPYGEIVEIPVFKNEKAPITVSFEHAYSNEPLVVDAVDLEQVGRLRLYRVVPPALGDELWRFAERNFKPGANPSRYIAYSSNFKFSLFLSLTFFLFFVLVRNYYLEKRLRKGIADLLRKGVIKKHV